MIANTGVDAKSWWWYLNVTPSQISSYLNTNHARLIDIERAGSGTYNVIMQAAGSEYWWWYYGKSASSIGTLASQNGARIYDIESYTVLGVRYFAALMINDVNAETSRLREIMRGGLDGGSYGVYLKRIGSGTDVNLQEGVIFEPASALKALHLLHALRRVQAGSEFLTTDITWYAKPTDPARYPGETDYGDDKNKCAYTDTGVLQTSVTYVDDLGPVVLMQMMRQSDNRTTDALVRRYGFAALNATADLAGMTKTQLYHRIGCPAASSPQPWHHNELTLVDAGKLYEGVSNAAFLSGSNATTFWNTLLGGAIDASGALAKIVREEATSLGKTTALADAFIANTQVRSKGGSYDSCPASGSCNPPYIYTRTAAGRIQLPFKNRLGTIVPRYYVFGRFVDGLAINCTFKGSSEGNDAYAARCPSWKAANDAFTKAGNELFRAQIRAALLTW